MEIHAKRFRFFPWLFAAFLLMFSTSCANVNLDEMTKAAKGTITGAAAGAVACGLATGDVRAAAVCGVAGAVVGYLIGAYLDEQDQKKLEELQTEALKNGKEQSFVTHKTGDTLTITPSEIEQKIETYELAEGVQAHNLIPANEVDIPAHVNTPVYSDTNTKKEPRYILKQGSKLLVPMHVVADKPKSKPVWGAVVDKPLIGNSRVVGYVQISYLDPKTAEAYQPPVKKTVKTKAVPAKTAKAPRPSPAPKAQAAAKESPEAASPAPPTQTAAEAPASQPKPEEEGGIILVSEAPSSEAAARPVELNIKCRTTRIKVKALMEEHKFCEKPPPSWIKV